MQKVLNLYKPLGKTPLEAIKIFQDQNSEYKNIKIAYAGRLDPLAEGVLIVLVGEELKNQKRFWNLNKEYEAKILLGVTTDTYDILGLPTISQFLSFNFQISKSSLQKIIKKYKGKYTFSLPPFSSYKIRGKPLFYWAREGKLNEIDIPKKEIEIKKIKLVKLEECRADELEKKIMQKLNLVKGDFRQQKIKQAWRKTFTQTEQKRFTILNIKISCSSGTYVRSLTHEIGLQLNSGAILFHLIRTRVGKFKIKNSIKLYEN